MKTIISLCLMIFLSLVSFSSLGAPAVQPVSQVQSEKTNPEILKIVMVINQNEITAGNEAAKKTTNNDVKNFALTMIKDHGQNLQDAQTLSQNLKITPKDSAKSLTIQKKGKDLMNKLTALQGQDFNKTYVDAMVNGHQEALKIIDVDLIPKTSTPELTKFLQATRLAVAQHLEMAKELQKKI